MLGSTDTEDWGYEAFTRKKVLLCYQLILYEIKPIFWGGGGGGGDFCVRAMVIFWVKQHIVANFLKFG
jgi:hypothetical protein